MQLKKARKNRWESKLKCSVPWCPEACMLLCDGPCGCPFCKAHVGACLICQRPGLCVVCAALDGHACPGGAKAARFQRKEEPTEPGLDAESVPEQGLVGGPCRYVPSKPSGISLSAPPAELVPGPSELNPKSALQPWSSLAQAAVSAANSKEQQARGEADGGTAKAASSPSYFLVPLQTASKTCEASANLATQEPRICVGSVASACTSSSSV